jgi:hypothetical protein
VTTPNIRVKVVRKPTLKLKVLPKFPANVVAQNFLTVTRANGTYTFSVDYTVLTPGPIADATTAMVAVLDQTTGIYKEVSLSSLLTSGLDADLQAIAALTGTGILARTASNTWSVRTITAGASIGVTNGDGVSGNPTIAVTDAELVALAGLASAADKLPYFTGSGTASLADFTAFARTLVDDANQGAMQTTLGLVPGMNVQAFDSDLAALAANASTGLWSVTGSGTGSVRTITAPAAGITVSNGGGVAGNPTLALADDLSALEGLSGTGIARRTGTSAWSTGTAVANSELATMGGFTFKGNNTSGSATPTDVDIALLTSKASPASSDLVMISDQAASGAWKKVTVSSLASAGSVSSIAGNTGAFTLGTGLSNNVNSLINTGAVTVKQQSFSASGTYTPSTGMIFAIVECIGGGGGGGGASGTAGQVYGGAGGWSGAYSRALVTAATVGASKAVTVGAGGGGGAGAAAGSTGGATSVGALCVANGGTGGQFGSSAQFPTPLTGPATGTGNMIAVGGNPGIHGFYSTIITVQGYSGAGGSSVYGGGGAAVTASSAGSTGTSASGVGSGGSGAIVHNTAGGASGGSGSNGYVVITEFNSQ